MVHSSLPEERGKEEKWSILASQKREKQGEMVHSSLPEREETGRNGPF